LTSGPEAEDEEKEEEEEEPAPIELSFRRSKRTEEFVRVSETSM
jgi:hypothetical protein